MTITNKLLRDLVNEVRATPGFEAIEEGQHVKVTGPTGTAMLRTGRSVGHDDKDWRKALRRYAGWPPTNVGEALSLAQVKAAGNGAASVSLPPQEPTPIFDPVPKKLLGPSSVERPTPVPQTMVPLVTRSPKWGTGGRRWLDAVIDHLRELRKQRTIEQIIQAVPPKHYGLAAASASAEISRRWIAATGDDPMLHIYRGREIGKKHYQFWWEDERREPARPDPESEVIAPKPINPLVVEYAAKLTPIMQEADAMVVKNARIPSALPEVFERVGDLLGDLLLRDENGDIWRARKGLQ